MEAVSYTHLPEKPFVSINSLGPELNRRTVSCYGFSKGYALPGLRAGFLYALDKDAFAAVEQVANGSYGGVDYVTPVSYTHLDVYKRPALSARRGTTSCPTTRCGCSR